MLLLQRNDGCQPSTAEKPTYNHMEILKNLLETVLHLREHIGELISQYGSQIYTIFFLIIFCETGLVLTPFLPISACLPLVS